LIYYDICRRNEIQELDGTEDGGESYIESLDSHIRAYNTLQLGNNLFNKVFGASAWLPSLLSALITVLPFGLYGIIKLGWKLDIFSYAYCTVAVPCIFILLLAFYSPMESLQFASAQLSDKNLVYNIISKVSSKNGSETRQKSKKKRNYVKALLNSGRPLQCKLYCFGFIDKQAKTTLFKLIVDSTIYILLTF
jgi:hypothetical protein